MEQESAGKYLCFRESPKGDAWYEYGRVPDEGACVELGIAYASGKRCYGFKSDARSIELDMDLNPMISGCFIKTFYNLNGEELIKSLEEYLKDNEL